MKRILVLSLLLALVLPARAQRVSLEADIRFHSALVNNEFDVSDNALMPSLTIAVARLTPYVGLRFGEGDHRLMAGADAVRDFGTPGTPLTVEPVFWYQYNWKSFTLAAGIYPRALLGGEYSSAILSDPVRFYDAHLEGFMLRWKKGRSNYEIALDWNGKYGAGRREQFNVISAGRGWLNSWLGFGWEGMFHHYACSQEVNGVVDDHILHPYVLADFSSFTGLEALSLQAGAIVGYQADRITSRRSIPVGASLVADVRKWGFGLRNEAYYGDSQAPYFHDRDEAGNIYASNLYIRSSVWEIRPGGGSGFYDRIDLYWGKRLCPQVNVSVRLVAHFTGSGFLGTQQIGQVLVNLDRLSFKGKGRR